MTAPRRDSVQSLERAFDLLEALAAAGGELGVTELANRTGLVPSTVHRLLATLLKRGYVAQGGSGRYRLGYKASALASGAEQRLARLRAVAHPHMERVAAQTGETVNLVVLDGDRVIYVDQVEGTRRVRMFTAVGTAAPAHTTGSGKAIMAYGPAGAVAALYSGREPLERLTTSTLVTIAELEADFERIRARGYAIDAEEHELGVGCVATPVFDHTARPVAAISVSGPTTRILRGEMRELAALLGRHAAEVSAALGYEAVGAA